MDFIAALSRAAHEALPAMLAPPVMLIPFSRCVSLVRHRFRHLSSPALRWFRADWPRTGWRRAPNPEASPVRACSPRR